MNKKQLVALCLGVAAEVAALLYPPWVRQQAIPSGVLQYARTWMWLWQGAQPELPPAIFSPPMGRDLEEKMEWSRKHGVILPELLPQPDPEPVPLARLLLNARVIDVPVLCIESGIAALFFGTLIFLLKNRSRPS